MHSIFKTLLHILIRIGGLFIAFYLFFYVKLVDYRHKNEMILIFILLSGWLIFLLFDVIYAFRLKQKNRKTASFSLLLITFIIVSFGYYLLYAPKYLRTVYSPDKKYRLEIYEEPRLFTMPGDGGTRGAHIKLYKGFWRVKNDYSDNPCFTRDIEIRWDMERGKVWYHERGYMNLEPSNVNE